ncbi:MAG: hypothetical protein KGI79_00075 [Patescibacteria group bacterium]|nr:hypothetical protein [Patescibacteria group bacterium]MDE2116267.1 hypothetical protein [Patescibacteria group bacterium]
MARLIATKWGPAIEFEGRLAFLEYGGDASDFEIGAMYHCKIFYRIIYATTPEGAAKNWSFLEADTREELERRPEFEKYGLDAARAHPCFSIAK